MPSPVQEYLLSVQLTAAGDGRLSSHEALQAQAAVGELPSRSHTRCMQAGMQPAGNGFRAQAGSASGADKPEDALQAQGALLMLLYMLHARCMQVGMQPA